MWDVPCIRETYAEDNDTEESESEEEETKKDMSQQAMISDMLDRRSVTLRNLRKGLRFFMDLEKKELKKRAKIERARKMKN